jgi:hypothetical protein
MNLEPVPIIEVEGKKTGSNRNLFNGGLFDLDVISHQDESLVCLRFLSTTIAVEVKRLQAAIQSATKWPF